MAEIDNDLARESLHRAFAEVEHELDERRIPAIPGDLQRHLEVLFASNTQAYREILVGCILARLQDKRVDVHLPYVNQGETAYHGRDLDEEVVNPFLKEKEIPSSGGPFLSVFRRSVRFDASIRGGLRDKTGYDSLLVLVDYVAATNDDAVLFALLKVLLSRFIQLRETSQIAIAKVQRLSLNQICTMMDGLLAIPSGGRSAMFIVAATFRALNDAFKLGWTIEYHGINVADAAKGEAGDITVKRDGDTLMAAEVTERPVDKARVVSTFRTKIAPSGIQDYLFFVKDADRDAIQQAQQYFSQGLEVNFLQIQSWIRNILAVIGSRGREDFVQQLIALIDQAEVPRRLKVGWNDLIQKLTTYE